MVGIKLISKFLLADTADPHVTSFISVRRSYWIKPKVLGELNVLNIFQHFSLFPFFIFFGIYEHMSLASETEHFPEPFSAIFF